MTDEETDHDEEKSEHAAMFLDGHRALHGALLHADRRIEDAGGPMWPWFLVSLGFGLSIQSTWIDEWTGRDWEWSRDWKAYFGLLIVTFLVRAPFVNWLERAAYGRTRERIQQAMHHAGLDSDTLRSHVSDDARLGEVGPHLLRDDLL